VVAQFIKKDVPQVVQGFSELEGVDRGLAVPVLKLQSLKLFAFDQETCKPWVLLLKSYLEQSPAIAKKIRPSKQVCRLHSAPHIVVHLLPLIDFLWEIG